MKRIQRTPLVKCNKPIEDIEDIKTEDTKKEVITEEPSLGNAAGEINPGEGYPTTYPIPENSCANDMYIPLIKNVISDREMMWKDGYNFGSITRADNTSSYLAPACNKVYPLEAVPWARVYMDHSFITILGDGAVYSFGADGSDRKFSHIKELVTCTDKLCVIYSGASYGLTIILRLIDKRIENAAGEDNPQVVTYDPRCDVFKTTRGGWWNNWVNFGGNSGGDPVNMALSGCAYLMYTWNVMNTGKSKVLLYQPNKRP